MEHILHRQKPNQIQQLTPQKRATVGLFFHKMYIQCLLYVTHYKIPIHPITFVYMLMICSQHTPWFHGRWLDCCPTYRFHHATTFCRHFLFIFFLFYFWCAVVIVFRIFNVCESRNKTLPTTASCTYFFPYFFSAKFFFSPRAFHPLFKWMMQDTHKGAMHASRISHQHISPTAIPVILLLAVNATR